MNKKVIDNILYLIFIFFISSILGGIIEIIFQILQKGSFNLNGFLYFPIRPIYGWGSLLLYFICKKFNKNILTVFISSFLIFSIFEYLSSYILELIFDHCWWNYEEYVLNINGRICLSISICWGLLGVLFLLYIEPVLHRVFKIINKKVLTIVSIILFISYIIDTIFSIIRLIC